MTRDNHGFAVIVDAGQHMASQGQLYGFYVEDTDLDTGESKDTLIVTGDYPVRITLDLQAYGGQLIAYIYEDTIISAEGTLTPISAFNRVSSYNTTVKIYEGPSILDVGQVFVKRRVLAHSQGNSGITSAVSSGVFRLLKPRSKYLLRQTAAADNVAMTLSGIFSDEIA